jgi:hypothetical protein
MLAPNAVRAMPVVTGHDPRDSDQLGGSINQRNITKPNISATLIGANRCDALGITATDHAPVLSLCRQLLGQGVDPDTALTVYRRGILALKIRSIGEAARLTVKSTGNGRPVFALDAGGKGAGAPPMRKNGEGHHE